MVPQLHENGFPHALEDWHGRKFERFTGEVADPVNTRVIYSWKVRFKKTTFELKEIGISWNKTKAKEGSNLRRYTCV